MENPKADETRGGADARDCVPRLVRRGPLERTTGMIRVPVEVQREKEGLWYARTYPDGSLRKGSTREEAIQAALEASSI